MRPNHLTLSLVAICGIITAAHADQNGQKSLLHAFSVGKETNQSYVSYEIGLTPGCQIVKKDPLTLSWVTPLKEGGVRRDSLNGIENNLYGMDIEKADPTLLQGEINAIKSRGVKLTVRIIPKVSHGTCTVSTYVAGERLPHEVMISSIYLQHFSGQKPSQVAIIGRDITSGKPERYILDFA